MLIVGQFSGNRCQVDTINKMTLNNLFPFLDNTCFCINWENDLYIYVHEILPLEGEKKKKKVQ